jgi:hypothetical protein
MSANAVALDRVYGRNQAASSLSKLKVFPPTRAVGLKKPGVELCFVVETCFGGESATLNTSFLLISYPLLREKVGEALSGVAGAGLRFECLLVGGGVGGG